MTPGADGAYRILALDGGGVRGIFQAALLKNIELSRRITIADHCHLIAGTSVGAILAMGLSVGYPASNVVDILMDAAPDIFRGRLSALLRWTPVEASLATGRLRRHLTKMFQATDRKTLGECLPTTLVTATALNSYRSREFCSDDDTDGRLSPVDVALATSAAPTYFRPHRIGATTFIDGGFWANNPTLAAITRVACRGIPYNRLRVLSIGTGRPLRMEDAEAYGGKWKVGWAHPSLDLLFTSQSDSVDKFVQRIAPLFGSYCRVDPDLGKHIELCDHQAALKYLPPLADELLDKDEVAQKIEEWFHGD